MGLSDHIAQRGLTIGGNKPEEELLILGQEHHRQEMLEEGRAGAMKLGGLGSESQLGLCDPGHGTYSFPPYEMEIRLPASTVLFYGLNGIMQLQRLGSACSEIGSIMIIPPNQ